jgi:hypothetical protein
MNWHWLSLSIVRVGSKPEELTASICRLLFIQYRTSGSATLPAANLVAVQNAAACFQLLRKCRAMDLPSAASWLDDWLLRLI